jgi:hypothetical protein
MRLAICALLCAACQPVWRFAAGPTAETHKTFGAATSASITPSWATNRARTHWAGPLFGLETLGMSGSVNGGFGLQVGVDSLSEFPDQRLAFGAGAKIGVDLGLPDVQALARATVHLDLGGRLRNRGACASYLGAGIEAGPQFGERVPVGGWFAVSLVYRLAGHEVEHKCEEVY